MDWNDWHKRYDTAPGLAMRLRIVCEQIAIALDECPAGPVKMISLCAGDGRDVIGAICDHPRRHDVNAWLLDTDAESLARGSAAAAAAGLEHQLRFFHADASMALSYEGLVPADIILLSGFLGHIRPGDAPVLINSLPMLCRNGGYVIWNKHLVANDGSSQVQTIRNLLESAGCADLHFETTDSKGYAVGRARFNGQEMALESSKIFFKFVS